MSHLITRGLLIKSLYPLYIIGSFIGLSPYIITQKGELFSSHWRGPLQTLVALIYSFCTITTMNITFGDVYQNFESILKIIIAAQHFLWQFITVFCIVLELVNKNELVKILENLQEVDVKFVVKSSNFGYQEMDYRDNFIFIAKGFGFILTVSTYSHYENTWYFDFDTKTKILATLTFLSTYFVLPVVILKFMTLNFCVTKRLRMVNRVLGMNEEKLKKEQVSSFIFLCIP